MQKNPIKLITYRINVTPKKLSDVKKIFYTFNQAVSYLDSKAPKTITKFHHLKKLYFRALQDKFRLSEVLVVRVIGKVSTARIMSSGIRADLMLLEKKSFYITESKMIIDSPLSIVADYDLDYCDLEVKSGLLILKDDRLLLSVRFVEASA